MVKVLSDARTDRILGVHIIGSVSMCMSACMYMYMLACMYVHVSLHVCHVHVMLCPGGWGADQ